MQVVLEYRNNRFYFHCSSPTWLHELTIDLMTLYAKPNPKARHSTHADDFVTPFTDTGGFFVGMAIDIIKNARKLRPEMKLTMSPKIRNIIKPLNVPEDKLQNYVKGSFEARDYQHDSVVRSMKSGRNTLLLPTGAGKSLTTYGILKNLMEVDVYPILMIVPNIQLVQQAYTDFLEYGMHKNLIQRFSAKFNRVPNDNPIIITNTQFLTKHLDKLPEIKAVYVDECHMLKKESNITAVVRKFKVPIKIGCTATLPDNPEDLWSVIGTLGPVIKKESITNLQDRGFLSTVRIRSIQYKHNDLAKLRDMIDAKHMEKAALLAEYDMEIHRLKPGKSRDKLIAKRTKVDAAPVNEYLIECQYVESHRESLVNMLKFVLKLKGNTVVMFNRTAHGQLMYKVLKRLAPDRRVDYVDGNVDLSDRIDATESMEESEGNIIVSNTKCFGTGVNVKKIHNIVISGGGKAFITTLQVIGRGLRKHESKDRLNLWDIHHDLKYSKKHYEYRQKLYYDNYLIPVDVDKKLDV